MTFSTAFTLGLGLAIHATADSTDYDRLYAAVREARPDPARIAEVHDLTLMREQGTLHLLDGRIEMLEKIDGRDWGAVFEGAATFTLDPPVAVERAQMERTYGDEHFAREVQKVVLVFTDWTADELTSALDWPTGTPIDDADDQVRDALDRVTNDGWMTRDLMVPLLDRGGGLFWAAMSGDGDPFVFQVNPYDYEEVSLSRRTGGRGKALEPVVQFHKTADYKSGSSLPQEALDLLTVDHYDVEATIEDGLDLEGRTTAHVTQQAPGHPWVPFYLHPELDVDSVTLGGGGRLPIARGRKAGDVWVDLGAAPPGSLDLVFTYHGKILERPDNSWIVMKTTTDWYPKHQYGRPASFRLTFHSPKKYTVATVGKLVSRETQGDVTTSVYETPIVHQVTFNIGDFETTDASGASGPRLAVQLSTRSHQKLRRDMLRERGVFLLQQEDMAGSVGRDLRTSFAFFTQVFGPTTVEDFTATEIPYAHGEAYPGLVLLSALTFQNTDEKGYQEMFRAHEVAHQWWGIGVRPATYHDRWLAEGFAEFSGLWYMARARGSMDVYQKRLEEGRKRILDRRDKAAPIWLGTRVSNSRHPEDYQTVIYDKGAWVLHMLRMLLTDFHGANENVFDHTMHDFYSGNLDKAASTEAFQRTLEENVGQPMQWFFDDWVYGSSIPTYTFSYKLDEQPDGTWKATVRVRQKDVPADFKMIVPILVDFGKAGNSVVKLMVAGPVTEQVLPILPSKPDGIELNPYEAVLAEVHTERWVES